MRFSFSSDANNLETITPDWMHFQVVTAGSTEMRAGAHIDYRLRYRGIPMIWRSEITVWDPPHRFVDVQIKGPYREWIHEHMLVGRNGGTIASDHVEYSVLGGTLINALFMRHDVQRILAHRHRTLRKVFCGSSSFDSA